MAYFLVHVPLQVYTPINDKIWVRVASRRPTTHTAKFLVQADEEARVLYLFLDYAEDWLHALGSSYVELFTSRAVKTEPLSMHALMEIYAEYGLGPAALSADPKKAPQRVSVVVLDFTKVS